MTLILCNGSVMKKILITMAGTKTTPASPEAVLNTLQNFRGNVVGCATEGGGGVSRTDAFFAHAIVSELDVALVVQQYIV